MRNAHSGTLTLTTSIITGNGGRGVVNCNGTTVTMLNSTIVDNTGVGVANYSYATATILNSTIADNTDGGVLNEAACTVTNSTISGNSTTYSGGGGGLLNFNGTLTVRNSTITGNHTDINGGGVLNVFGTLTLARTLVSGNTAPIGPEGFNDPAYGTVVADNYNLFGLDGAAGVEGFSPGPTDVVPPTGVQLSDILDPTLALHGGQTQTHALVPGSPAIDAGGPVCLDADGEPLTTDQRGQPRPVDGNGDGTPACDIGAFEFFPLVDDFVTLDPAPETSFDPTPVPGSPAGTFTITATFTNTSATPLRFPFFEVTTLSGGNLLLNADEGPGGVGATLTPEVGDRVLAAGEPVTVDFVIGLQARAPFTFVVELFGEPRR